MRISNYHTHTVFCDGRDTPEELVLEALRLGCPELGFSGHSFLPGEDWCMSPEGTEEYKAAVRKLKTRYDGQIKIYLGVEQDIHSTTPVSDYDYVIGSVHSVCKDGKYLSVDYTRDFLIRAVREHYKGDFYALIEDYYALVGQVVEKTRCNIVGHFDLVTKFNAGGALFDTAHPRYRRAALAALDRLAASPAVFEINTGAVARGYRADPYPERFLLDELRRRRVPLLLNSDCHDRRDLLYGLEALHREIPEARETIFG